MKRLVVVLSGLLVLPAFAEVAPVYYDEIMEYSDAEIMPSDDAVVDEVAETKVVEKPVVASAPSARASGRIASRAVPTGQSNVTTRSASGRGVASRTTTARPARDPATVARAAKSRATRKIKSAIAGKTVTARSAATTTAKPAVAARASIVQTDTVNQSLYSGRVGASTRSSTLRARMPVATISNATIAATDAATMVSNADEMAQLTDYCKAQYTQCMDNYCDVLDENQGRCSCSKNLKNYEKTEEALKSATQALQEVAQQIQYIGLTGDQIETLFSQTEAESAMQSNTDNTQLKNMIMKIGDGLVEVKSGTANVGTNGLTMDFAGLLDGVNFSGGIVDFSVLLGGGTNTSSINNQRGETLYKTASARCKASVLDTCSAQGVDVSVITNSYDLEIDKQCLIYERSLEEANDNMTNTVRNARSVLQRARLLVDQQKNQFNLLECIQELDKCMQDEFVCGSDYEECLDPTGKYIASGNVVAGSTPGTSGSVGTTGIYETWKYNSISPWSKDGNVDEYVATYLGKDYNSSNRGVMAAFLQEKIGYIEEGKAYGMCSGVLNQCQQYTYTTKNKKSAYNKSNKVVEEYLKRTMIKIKVAQDEVLADYAEDCIENVSTCLSANGVSVNQTAAQKACRSYIDTCASVSGAAKQEVIDAAMKEASGSKWVAVTYDFNGCATGWENEPNPYAELNVTLTFPAESDLKMAEGKTFSGWKYLDKNGDEVTSASSISSLYDTLEIILQCEDATTE
ncbi:MAG: hypothetical protein J6R22_01665 [Alphaproteobacteria bacterium]|nr:hypothetical protein [Alphaproteobacteria bacterium]